MTSSPLITETLTIALAQANPTLGAIDANADLVRAFRADAAAAGADLVVFSELVITGYPPEDLILKAAFGQRARDAVEALARETDDGGPAIIMGTPWVDDGGLFNAAVLLDGGEICAVRRKHELPNYGVFDEARVFKVGPLPEPVPFRGVQLGLMICEDMWGDAVTDHLVDSGAEILIVINGSPFDVEKPGQRRGFAAKRIAQCKRPLAYVNQIGGQDELVFDGASFVMDAGGQIVAQGASWSEDMLVTTWQRTKSNWAPAPGDQRTRPTGHEAIYEALVLGLRDYVTKNGFPGIVLGLSGGIDSALSAAIAVDALGAEKVHTVMMPSPYTSGDSLEDAALCAQLLGTRLDTVSIEPAMAAFDGMLGDLFVGHDPDVTEENIQARSRAIILMGLSNKFGSMVLTTGNKSEMSVGYATLYGDMCGGYSVLKDIYKIMVFELSRWRNENYPETALGPHGPVMPERVITKPPSAELRPDQKDEDSLPPYDDLDVILHNLIEEEASVDQVCALGYERDTVRRIWRLLDRAEYKRRQAPPGVKITQRSFGKDRRYPITNHFTDLC